jgi:hypothetical protein
VAANADTNGFLIHRTSELVGVPSVLLHGVGKSDFLPRVVEMFFRIGHHGKESLVLEQICVSQLADDETS